MIHLKKGGFMRADRLLKMLLLLQTKGRHTAGALARSLEVSVRTIYRDVIALSFAGIPIYTEKGPGGGIQLIEDYRTSLTGLSEDEVKALFMLNIPAALASLGMSDEIQRALLKLSAALPNYLQEAQASVQQRIMVDLADWKPQPEKTPSYLGSLYQAVWGDKCIRVVVQYAFGYSADRVLEAYGLVSRGEDWYLVCRVEEHFKAFSIQEFKSLSVLEETFDRLTDFDLADFWQMWLMREGLEQNGYQCTILISREVFEYLRRSSSVEMISMEEVGDTNQIRIVMRFSDFSHARTTILGFGGAVKILAPTALKMSVADYARQILKIYED
jgi:predicted DNA-binding transcriptional regulator YafY